MENTQELGIGWLYVVTHANARGLVKIGITDRPNARMDELDKPEILARVPVAKPRHCERHLHNHFRAQRVPQTEWFGLDDEQLEELFQLVESVAQPFLDLIVMPGAVTEEEQGEDLEPSEESTSTIPNTQLPQSDQSKTGPPGSGRIAELRQKLGIETWRAEMLQDYGLD